MLQQPRFYAGLGLSSGATIMGARESKISAETGKWNPAAGKIILLVFVMNKAMLLCGMPCEGDPDGSRGCFYGVKSIISPKEVW